jgi:hypothetical protein
VRYAQKQNKRDFSNNITQILPSLGLGGTILGFYLFQVDTPEPDSGANLPETARLRHNSGLFMF